MGRLSGGEQDHPTRACVQDNNLSLEVQIQRHCGGTSDQGQRFLRGPKATGKIDKYGASNVSSDMQTVHRPPWSRADSRYSGAGNVVPSEVPPVRHHHRPSRMEPAGPATWIPSTRRPAWVRHGPAVCRHDMADRDRRRDMRLATWAMSLGHLQLAARVFFSFSRQPPASVKNTFSIEPRGHASKSGPFSALASRPSTFPRAFFPGASTSFFASSVPFLPPSSTAIFTGPIR